MKTIKIPFTNKVIVDRKELFEIEYVKDIEALKQNIYGEKVEYICDEGREEYFVLILNRYTLFPIKIFPFGDDKEYARLCAEELCEMLNSKM